MKIFNRSLITAILFLMTGVGVTFATGSNQVQNFLLGENSNLRLQDLGPAVVLMAGPEGAVGPMGPAGEDGAPGIQGEQGLQGVSGPQGPQGEQGLRGETGPAGVGGASVSTALLNVGDSNCPTGGVAVTSQSETLYICNGRQGAQGLQGVGGPQGATGPAGANGVGGGGGGTGTGFGAGTLTAGVCDDSIDVQLRNTFAGGKFALNQVVISNVKAACVNSTLRVYFSIRSSGALFGDGALAGKYSARTPADEIVCVKSVSGANWTGSGDARQITIESTDTCVVSRTSMNLDLGEISARDIQENIGFEIG